MMEQPPLLGSTMKFEKECELVLHIPFTTTVLATGFNQQGILAANVVPEVSKMFGTTGNIWKLFYYSPKKVESLKEVQSVLKLPEFQIVKPSDIRWLSHKHCIWAIY